MSLQNVFKKLWRCERGFVVSSDLIFLSTIVIIGVIVGLSTIRDQVVQEYGDASTAVGALNQSFSFLGVENLVGSSAGSVYDDSGDDCDGFGFDPVNAGAACINVNGAVHPPAF